MGARGDQVHVGLGGPVDGQSAEQHDGDPDRAKVLRHRGQHGTGDDEAVEVPCSLTMWIGRQSVRSTVTSSSMAPVCQQDSPAKGRVPRRSTSASGALNARCPARGRSRWPAARQRGPPPRPRRCVAATCAAVSEALTAILAPTSSSSGPRWSVFMWMMRSTPGVASRAASIRAGRPASRLAQQQALGLDRQHDRDHHEQDADHRRARDVEVVVLGDQRQDHGRQSAKTRPRSAARSSSRITGSSGCLACRTNCWYDASPLTLFVSMIAVRNEKRLQHDRDAEHRERHPPPLAGVLVVARPDLVELVVRLVQREEPAHGEQHDRDDERVDVALAAVAERVLLGRLALGPLAADAAAAPGSRRRPPSGSPRPASS